MIMKYKLWKTRHRSLHLPPQASCLLLEKPLSKSESTLKPKQEFSARELDEHRFINKDLLVLGGWVIF